MDVTRWITDDERLVRTEDAWYVVTEFKPHGTKRAFRLEAETGVRTRVYYNTEAAIIKAARDE